MLNVKKVLCTKKKNCNWNVSFSNDGTTIGGLETTRRDFHELWDVLHNGGNFIWENWFGDRYVLEVEAKPVFRVENGFRICDGLTITSSLEDSEDDYRNIQQIQMFLDNKTAERLFNSDNFNNDEVDSFVVEGGVQ